MARWTPAPSTCAGALLALAATATLVTILVAGCSSDMGLPPPMTIVNRTELAVEVTIVGQPEDFEELPKMLAGGGGMMLLAGPFQQGDRPCIQGRLVATRNGQTVATIDKPCAGSRWDITVAAAS